MSRIGINPARGKLIKYRPARVSVTLLTYIPDLSGYFEDRLNILKIVLGSLRVNTSIPYDLLVFDNGSCQEVREFLTGCNRAGEINYLILSDKNIGKIDAFQILFNAAPGEIIAYSDDDIFFYPNWLEAQLEILDSYPNAGMISGTPVRNASMHARESLDRLITDKPDGITISNRRVIPDDWEIDWAISTGRDVQEHLRKTQHHQDLVLRTEDTKRGIVCEAIGSANHFQFITPKKVILQALPNKWSGKLMGSMVELDEAIDQLGYLRLSTTQRYTRHLGNVLNDGFFTELKAMGLHKIAGITQSKKKFHTAKRSAKKRNWLLQIPGSRRVLSAVYHRLFQILYK
jgi:glycosyltransferase involved in cell wall biosynthesis